MSPKLYKLVENLSITNKKNPQPLLPLFCKNTLTRKINVSSIYKLRLYIVNQLVADRKDRQEKKRECPYLFK
jgi:hypothetical protein